MVQAANEVAEIAEEANEVVVAEVEENVEKINITLEEGVFFNYLFKFKYLLYYNGSNTRSKKE